jgi:hypothetical protein
MIDLITDLAREILQKPRHCKFSVDPEAEVVPKISTGEYRYRFHITWSQNENEILNLVELSAVSADFCCSSPKFKHHFLRMLP